MNGEKKNGGIMRDLCCPVADGGTYAPAATSRLEALLGAIRKKRVKSFWAFNQHYERVVAYSHGGILWYVGKRITCGKDSGREYVFTNTLYRDSDENRRLFNVLSGIERVKTIVDKESQNVRDRLRKVRV